jgi:hypothetical protein
MSLLHFAAILQQGDVEDGSGSLAEDGPLAIEVGVPAGSGSDPLDVTAHVDVLFRHAAGRGAFLRVMRLHRVMSFLRTVCDRNDGYFSVLCRCCVWCACVVVVCCCGRYHMPCKGVVLLCDFMVLRHSCLSCRRSGYSDTTLGHTVSQSLNKQRALQQDVTCSYDRLCTVMMKLLDACEAAGDVASTKMVMIMVRTVLHVHFLRRCSVQGIRALECAAVISPMLASLHCTISSRVCIMFSVRGVLQGRLQPR